MSSERSTVTVVLCVASVFNLLTAECLVPYASDNSWSVYYVKPSDVEYCPLHFQPCHILDYYVNTRVMRFANFPEVVRGSRKVCKNREIAHCYCITTWKVVVAKYYEVARRSAKFRARVNV